MENATAIIAKNIQLFRKKLGLKQEELADKLGITFQAVSKWENEKASPDITFLPMLADIFGCSIDDLFSRKNDNFTTVSPEIDGINWEDDGVIRGVVFEGRKMLKSSCIVDKFTFEVTGRIRNVSSLCNLTVNGDVAGTAAAGASITADSIEGDATCGTSITAENIEGDVTAGASVNATTVDGEVTAGGCVTADVIEGEVTAGGNVTADVIEGDVSANDVIADTIEGDVSGNNIKADTIEGDVSCSSVECDSIEGNVTVNK